VDQLVKLWHVQTAQEVAALRGHSRDVLAVAFSLDGTLLVSASVHQTIMLWHVKTRKELATLQGHTSERRP
jgi:WD40 repeat protein